MKKNDRNGVYIEILAMEKVKQLANSLALDWEDYLQPHHQHYSWRSQWPLKLHWWQRTRHRALSTETDYN